MRISFTKGFLKQFNKFPLKIRQAFRKRVLLFEINTRYPLLNNHALAGDYAGYHSINITGDWRAIYKKMDDGICFVELGTHSQLY